MYQTEIKGQETFPPARIIQYVLPFHPAFRGGAAVKRSESGMRTVPAGREDEDVSGTGDAVELLLETTDIRRRILRYGGPAGTG